MLLFRKHRLRSELTEAIFKFVQKRFAFFIVTLFNKHPRRLQAFLQIRRSFEIFLEPFALCSFLILHFETPLRFLSTVETSGRGIPSASVPAATDESLPQQARPEPLAQRFPLNVPARTTFVREPSVSSHRSCRHRSSSDLAVNHSATRNFFASVRFSLSPYARGKYTHSCLLLAVPGMIPVHTGEPCELDFL